MFLAAGAILLLVIGQQTLLSFGRKRTTRTKQPVEMGTSNPNNVDYDWLPKQTLAALSEYIHFKDINTIFLRFVWENDSDYFPLLIYFKFVCVHCRSIYTASLLFDSVFILPK